MRAEYHVVHPGVVPGHIHGFYLIYKKSQAEERYGVGNVEYMGNVSWL